jgi:hypothetical protein
LTRIGGRREGHALLGARRDTDGDGWVGGGGEVRVESFDQRVGLGTESERLSRLWCESRRVRNADLTIEWEGQPIRLMIKDDPLTLLEIQAH